jgi:hypothetical protein
MLRPYRYDLEFLTKDGNIREKPLKWMEDVTGRQLALIDFETRDILMTGNLKIIARWEGFEHHNPIVMILDEDSGETFIFTDEQPGKEVSRIKVTDYSEIEFDEQTIFLNIKGYEMLNGIDGIRYWNQHKEYFIGIPTMRDGDTGHYHKCPSIDGGTARTRYDVENWIDELEYPIEPDDDDEDADQLNYHRMIFKNELIALLVMTNGMTKKTKII